MVVRGWWHKPTSIWKSSLEQCAERKEHLQLCFLEGRKVTPWGLGPAAQPEWCSPMSSWNFAKPGEWRLWKLPCLKGRWENMMIRAGIQDLSYLDLNSGSTSF